MKIIFDLIRAGSTLNDRLVDECRIKGIVNNEIVLYGQCLKEKNGSIVIKRDSIEWRIGSNHRNKFIETLKEQDISYTIV